MVISPSLRLTVCACVVGAAVVVGSPVFENLGIQARVLTAALAMNRGQLASTALFGRDEGSADVLLVAVAMLQLVGIVMFEAWALLQPRRGAEERPGRRS